MSWYSTYLEVYNQEINTLSLETIKQISSLLKKRQSDTPLASVVLIAHNEEKRILSCLWSLANNQCSAPIEILIVNNNSSDGTEELLKRLQIPYYNETQKGPGFARQCGLNHAKGKYHICIDSDTIYPPHYIETHLKTLMKPNIVAAYSLWSFIPDSKHSARQLWFYESIRDLYLRLQSIKRPELCVRGMCFSFHTELGRKEGFRTDIIRGEDGSLALSLKKYGKVKFLTTQKARVVTSNNTLEAEGSLSTNLWNRFKKALFSLTNLFFRKSVYKDKDSNLIDK